MFHIIESMSGLFWRVLEAVQADGQAHQVDRSGDSASVRIHAGHVHPVRILGVVVDDLVRLPLREAPAPKTLESSENLPCSTSLRMAAEVIGLLTLAMRKRFAVLAVAPVLRSATP